MGKVSHRSDECGETFVGGKEVTEVVLSYAVDYIYKRICNHVIFGGVAVHGERFSQL